MNVRELKKPQKRIKPSYISRLNLQSYDTSNLYPQYIANFLAASPTAGSCTDRLATYIEGRGVADTALADTIVNRQRETLADIVHLCAEDFAKFNGFALHVTYNAFCEISGIRVVPFEDLRLFESDVNGYVSEVAYFPDWSEEETRGGKRLRVSEETLERFDVFNPDRAIVTSQIAAAGGIEFYKGQILYVTSHGRNIYPTAPIDRILNETSTDEGISNVKNRNVRNNFLPAGMIVHKGGVTDVDNLSSEERRQVKKSADGFSDAIEALQGDTNACNLLEVTIDYEDEKPEFVPITTNNYDKVFEATEASTIERIYSAFGQEAFYCLRVGKIGFSGSVMADAKKEYAEQQLKRQKLIARTLNDIFRFTSPELVAPGTKIEILPYVDLTKAATEL